MWLPVGSVRAVVNEIVGEDEEKHKSPGIK